MAVKGIKLGQVWRQDSSGQDYLVTKVYSEVFSQFAVLRPAEGCRASALLRKGRFDSRWRIYELSFQAERGVCCS